MDGMLALCAAIGTGNMGLLLDSYHWHTSHGTVQDIRKLQDSDVVFVHLNDALPGISVDELMDTVRALPGETGVIDLAGFLGALDEIGYTGPAAVEPFSERLNALPAEQALQETVAALQKVWRW
jgi:sugar phosphate isomerase/epimerase